MFAKLKWMDETSSGKLRYQEMLLKFHVHENSQFMLCNNRDYTLVCYANTNPHSSVIALTNSVADLGKRSEPLSSMWAEYLHNQRVLSGEKKQVFKPLGPFSLIGSCLAAGACLQAIPEVLENYYAQKQFSTSNRQAIGG